MSRFGWLTIPADSLTANDDGDLVGIESVWRPLVRSLNRKRKHWNKTAQPVLGFKPKKYHMLSLPCISQFGNWQAVSCRRCGTLFYNQGDHRQVGVSCSDKCYQADRAEQIKAGAKAAVEKRTETRAAARIDLRCQTCKEPLEAKRSTARYCSVRCRVTAHRAEKDAR